MDKIHLKEYALEDNEEVTLKKLEYHGRGDPEYAKARDFLVRATNDVFIEYNGGILLIERDNFPGKGILWAVGGGIERGVPIVESLKRKVKEECNLDLEEIKIIGIAREFWQTNSLSNGKGVDDLSIVFLAKGLGELRLDELHKNPKIVTPEEYLKIKEGLHPWVRDFLDKIMPMLKK